MHSIEELAGQHFDAVIVGGGINGAGLARDLAFHVLGLMQLLPQPK